MTPVRGMFKCHNTDLTLSPALDTAQYRFRTVKIPLMVFPRVGISRSFHFILATYLFGIKSLQRPQRYDDFSHVQSVPVRDRAASDAHPFPPSVPPRIRHPGFLSPTGYQAQKTHGLSMQMSSRVEHFYLFVDGSNSSGVASTRVLLCARPSLYRISFYRPKL